MSLHSWAKLCFRRRSQEWQLPKIMSSQNFTVWSSFASCTASRPLSCAQRVTSTVCPGRDWPWLPWRNPTHTTHCAVAPKWSCFQRTEPTTSAGITHLPYNWEANKGLLRPRQGWETSGGACARPFQGFKPCKAFAGHWQQKGTGGLYRHLTLLPNSAAVNTTYPRIDAQMLRGIIWRIKKN